MPFPLAHPAGVLPFQRYCPRFLVFPALVIGSLMPDLGYFFGPLHLHIFSHGLLGSFLFCLPMGIFFYVLLYWLRSLAIRKQHKSRLWVMLQLALPPRGSVLAVAGSLLVGTWSHDFLDSFTHESGWLSQRLPLLQCSFGSMGGHSIKAYSVLWYVCSFVGVGFVFLAFQNWRQKSFPTPVAKAPIANWGSALLVASAVVPIELLHRVFNNLAGILLVSLLTVLLILFVVRRVSSTETSMAR